MEGNNLRPRAHEVTKEDSLRQDQGFPPEKNTEQTLEDLPTLICAKTK
jgi:hypothetical protein